MIRRRLAQLTSAQRSAEATHSIDPGFVNHRLIQTLLRLLHGIMDFIDDAIRHLPPQPEGLQIKRISSIYSEFLLAVCKEGDAKPLSWLAAQPTPNPKTIICSTDVFQGTDAVWKARRASVVWLPNIRFDRTARLVFSPEHIFSTTQHEELSRKAVIAHVSRLKQVQEHDLILEPLVMGAPWVEGIDEGLREKLILYRYNFYSNMLMMWTSFQKSRRFPVRSTGA
jgi:hypothetical protein